jgi:hypothetical protein
MFSANCVLVGQELGEPLVISPRPLWSRNMRMNDYRTPRRASAKTAHTAGKELWQERSKPVLANGSQHTTAITPYYDSERRELRVGTIVLKCFTQGSDAQEIILASFQEENWCPQYR